MAKKIERIVLDAGILGLVTHPRPHRAFVAWWDGVLTSEVVVAIPEIADYEVRRELLRADKKTGVERLDQLKSTLPYLPLTTSVMLRAAKLWAQARQQGRPTADPKELDCDVILASQAIEEGAHVVTDNVGHLARFVSAGTWRDLAVEELKGKRYLVLRSG